MNIQTSLRSNRLLLEPLAINDSQFVLRLVNTDGWIRFIGDRHVTSDAEASGYIQKILDNPNSTYWVVKLKNDNTRLGVVTLLKKDYLEHHDIGFAFLPDFAGKGYAYEAASAVLHHALHPLGHAHISATTLPQNLNSLKLLQKLGLDFSHEINIENELLHVYDISADQFDIHAVTKLFFSVFTNVNNQSPDWNLLNRICIREVVLINKTEAAQTVYNLASFIEPRQKILTDGTLTLFEESETAGQTDVSLDIAQRRSEYRKRGIFKGEPFDERGIKYLQFIKTSQGWKISSALWQDENNNRPKS